jgi:hypothetical protein
MARRLAELSDRELTPLFNITVPEVRRLRQPSTGSFTDVVPEDMKAEFEGYEEWLWNLSVEEFRALRESNARIVALPLPGVPFDVAGRFRALQELLKFQGEFETH